MLSENLNPNTNVYGSDTKMYDLGLLRGLTDCYCTKSGHNSAFLKQICVICMTDSSIWRHTVTTQYTYH